LLNTVLGSLSSGVAASTSSYESIASYTVTNSTVSFTSIPSTYQHLQVRMIFDSAGSGVTTNFNSDGGSNYANHRVYGDGSSALATGIANTTQAVVSLYGGGYLAGTYGVAILDIHDYASTTKYKTVRSFYGYDSNGNGGERITLGSGLWMNTNAITGISFTGANFTGTVSLYGIKGA